LITRESFKPFARLKQERVEIQEMNGFVLVRELSAGEAFAMTKGGGFQPLTMLVKVLLNENGQPIFQDGDEDLVGNSLSVKTVNHLIEVATRLSGMTAREDVEKN
jgi:hypothetical protein